MSMMSRTGARAPRPTSFPVMICRLLATATGVPSMVAQWTFSGGARISFEEVELARVAAVDDLQGRPLPHAFETRIAEGFVQSSQRLRVSHDVAQRVVARQLDVDVRARTVLEACGEDGASTQDYSPIGLARTVEEIVEHVSRALPDAPCGLGQCQRLQPALPSGRRAMGLRTVAWCAIRAGSSGSASGQDRTGTLPNRTRAAWLRGLVRNRRPRTALRGSPLSSPRRTMSGSRSARRVMVSRSSFRGRSPWARVGTCRRSNATPV